MTDVCFGEDDDDEVKRSSSSCPMTRISDMMNIALFALFCLRKRDYRRRKSKHKKREITLCVQLKFAVSVCV